jgi:hypothetical protein
MGTKSSAREVSGVNSIAGAGATSAAGATAVRRRGERLGLAARAAGFLRPDTLSLARCFLLAMTIQSSAESLRSSGRDGKLIKPNFEIGDYLIDTGGQAHWTCNEKNSTGRFGVKFALSPSPHCTILPANDSRLE